MKHIGKTKTIPNAHVNGREMVHDLNPSVGNVAGKAYPPAKTSGVKIRGTGAATKGTMARGPMA